MYCEVCGAALVEREVEGRTRLVCAACGHVVYRQLKVGAGVLVDREGKVLLVQRGRDVEAFPGNWCLPAGYCEADEPPAMTAAREAQEETGLEVRIKCLGTVYYFEDDPRGNGLLMVYDATVTAGEIRTDGREIATAGFFAPDDLPAPLCRGGHDQAIREWQARALERWDPGEPLRYCPHCTCALEDRVAYGRERPVCPTCGYVHFLSPKVGVSVLVEEAGRVLLVQRAIEPGLGQWSLPSGFIEWDEPPETAAAREVAEETGLTVEDARLLSVEHYTEDFRGQGLNITYRASVAGGALVAADDAARVRFFAPDDLPQPEHIAFESHRAVLAHWAGGRAPEGA